MSALDLLRPTLCPACFAVLDRASMEVREPADGEPDGRVVGRRRAHENALTAQDKQRDRYFSCDLGHRIPADFFAMKCAAVAFVGPTKSMKSHFIVSTASQILYGNALERVSDSTHVSASIEDDQYPELVADIERLVVQRRMLDRTFPKLAGSPVRSPVAIRLEPTSDRLLAGNKPSCLMLFDAAGEELTKTKDQARVAPYLSSAAAIVVLVDPTQLDGVREHLGRGADTDRLLYPTAIVNSVTRTIRAHREMGTRQKIATPLHVVISRADLLDRATGPLTPYNGITRHDPDDPAVSALARSFVSTYARQILVQAHAAFTSVSYTFASATGHPADASGRFPDIEPWGCVELIRRIVRSSGLR